MNMKTLLISSILAGSLLLSSTASALLSDEVIAAQKRLEEAARDYAELTAGLKGDNANVFVKSFKFPQTTSSNKARLGIHIGKKVMSKNENGKLTNEESNANGVEVYGLTEGGPAEAAGIQEGDVITHLNGESLVDGDTQPMTVLIKFMEDVKPGDTLDVSYLRGELANVATLTTDKMSDHHALVFDEDLVGNYDIDIEVLDDVLDLPSGKSLKHLLGDGQSRFKKLFINRSPLGDAELVEISPELGEYFKAEDGILVVKAPSIENTPLRDGDVITAIDGREPKSVSHAIRILRSYEVGEEVNFNILRKKRKRTVSIEIPEQPEFSDFEFHGDNVLRDWKKKKD